MSFIANRDALVPCPWPSTPIVTFSLPSSVNSSTIAAAAKDLPVCYPDNCSNTAKNAW